MHRSLGKVDMIFDFSQILGADTHIADACYWFPFFLSMLTAIVCRLEGLRWPDIGVCLLELVLDSRNYSPNLV